MMFDRTALANWLGRPTGMLAVAMGVAAVLAMLPDRWTASMKGSVATVLRPGQNCATAGREQCEHLWGDLQGHWQTVRQLADTRRELAELKNENRRLRAELAATSASQSRTDGEPADRDRLLHTECVAANVLGQQARAFLGQHRLVNVGSQAGLQPDALVLDAGPGLIDRGADARLEADQFVLSRSCIWGKLVEVGRYTSTVRTVTEPGFRDLVRLGNPRRSARDGHSGPQGILEGTGEALARIRLVEITEPVTVGDAVYAAAGQGVLPEPLLYGHVVRVERAAGVAHWEIWMKPAVQRTDPDRVAVLRTRLNALRVADQ